MSFYTKFADVYEAIFPFSETVYAFLRRRFPDPPARVLDVGCGTGHYTAALASAGYDAVGIDLDPAMIEHAQAHYVGAGFRVLNMLDIAVLAPLFHGVACIGNTAAHLTQSEFARFLDAVRQAREPASPWILQVMNWDYVLTQAAVVFPVIEGEGGAVFHRSYRDISASQVTFSTRLEIEGSIVFEDAVPLYPLQTEAIIELHRERGFELTEHAGSYGGAPFDPTVFSANLFVFR